MRRFVWLLLAACVAAVPMSGGAAPAAERVPRQVLAFYYGWYGNPQVTGKWRHWNPAPDQKHADNIADTPRDGLYDSHDPAEIAREVAEARDAGITGLIASWWGQHSFEDSGMAPLLAAANRSGMKVTAYLERLNGDNEAARTQSAIEDLLYLLRTYAADPAWLRVDGKPVVFIYDRAMDELPLVGWRYALAQVRAQAPRGLVAIAKYDPAWLEVFDGAHDYNITQDTQGLSQPQLQAWGREHYGREVAAAGGKISCATVIPGFDDSSTDRPRPRPITERSNGQTYATLWQAAIAAKPDWVLITSWNEWHEGSEIEPAVADNGMYLTETRRFAGEFLSGRQGRASPK
ncbi:MAG: glycoside hydrolase family 99-like domain-containing protein [Alphaproteobacteria bacterium]|nr:glycoside hydrolase family 99-like domain-containing protein [Alphaproteobacteria bacterium]